ncbi:MAG: M20/M25/M40 family metallo-hydrolase [Bacteroidales bacterium]|nr:M20/M25/M40 family metallo-hydrolase [Bacteroidales bacterium]
MKKITLLMVSLMLFLASTAQTNDDITRKGLAAITENVLKAQLTFLSSDWMEGRETGEKGEYMSADYIASMLQLFGALPAGDYAGGGPAAMTGTRGATRERTYFQNFQLLKASPGEIQTMAVVSSTAAASRTTHFTYNVDYAFRNTAAGTEIDAPVIFVGYGIKNDKQNDFLKKDVRGKVILRISGLPESMRNEAGVSAIVASKDAAARELGAIAVLEVNPATTVLASGIEPRDFLEMSPSEGRPRSGRPSASLSIPQQTIPVQPARINVSVRLANEILEAAGFTVADFAAASGTKQLSAYPEITGKRIKLVSTVNTSLINVRNVLGVIEGVKKDEFIVVGAHYDHMGIGNGYIWNGADDNGSGTVGILTLVKAVSETGVKPQKSIIFALWTAEEKGLLGSRYWVENPTVPLGNVKMHINFDMISRYIADDQPEAVTMTYTASHPLFRQITEKNISKFNIAIIPDYQPSDNPPGGSDHRSFVAKNIPIMRFKPGHREEYHTPADEIPTLDWDIMEKVVKITFANMWELANTEWK